MGTSNFYNKNASKVYAFCISYEDDVLDENGESTGKKEIRQPEEYDWQDSVDYFRELLSEHKGYDKKDSWEKNGLRSYCGKVIGIIKEQKTFGDMDVIVAIEIISRSGYYEGSNLDWNLSYCYYNDFDDSFNEDDVKSDFVYYSDMNAGLATIQAKNACKWMEKTAESLVRFTEEVFEKCTTPLVVSARFSNGETWYQKAS
jgi:hypothetical protein